MKREVEKTKQRLEVAENTGDAEAIKNAEQKVKETEALKNELEELKDAADFSKEDIKNIVQHTEKSIGSGSNLQ